MKKIPLLLLAVLPQCLLAQKMFLIEDTIATQDAAVIALAVPVAGGF